MSKKAPECVKVAVRCRPLNENEIKNNYSTAVNIDLSRGEIILKNPKSESNIPKTYTFDKVYDATSTQQDIYQETAYPMVESTLEGYNSTIFAYGRTGSGKTHTMEGNPNDRGIMYRAFDHIFKHIQGTPDTQFLVYASYLEIYMEEIIDLLSSSDNKLAIRENQDRSVYVQGLTKVPVKDIDEIYETLKKGSSKRHVGSHSVNDKSSRSHAIFTVTVEASVNDQEGNNHIRVGKLNLVDLAGSERLKETKATGSTAMEGILICKSLVVLGTVISKLSAGDNFIPYRDSVLTRLLQNSLGGNSKTLMFANIGPAEEYCQQTSETLTYASRAKFIKQQPKVNQDPNTAMIKEFQDEISKLKAMLNQYQGSGEKGIIIPGETKIIKVEDETKIKEMEAKLAMEKEEIKRKSEAERQKIEDEKNLALEDKQRLLENLKIKEDAERAQKEEQEKLLKKLKKYEERVIKGKEAMKAVVEKEREQQAILQQLEEKKLAERRLEQELAKKDEENLMKEKIYNTQKEEIEDLKRKLYKIHKKYLESQAELQAKDEELVREREFYQERERDWDQVNKLKDLIINSFIPEAEIVRIENFANWDEEKREWFIPKGNLTGNNVRKPGSAYGLLRPKTSASRAAVALGDPNPRHRDHNVLPLKLEMPDQTLENFDGTVSEKITGAINVALAVDEDPTLAAPENQPNVYMQYEDDSGEKYQEPGVKRRPTIRKKKTLRGNIEEQSPEFVEEQVEMREIEERRTVPRRVQKEQVLGNEVRVVKEGRNFKENPPDKEYPRAKGLLGRPEKKV